MGAAGMGCELCCMMASILLPVYTFEPDATLIIQDTVPVGTLITARERSLYRTLLCLLFPFVVTY